VLEDGGGLVEHIVHGETGVVARGQADMAGWIARLAGDEVLRHSIGARGRVSVREKYTVERMVRANAGLYAGRTDPPQ
jgi:glycosyltransferase involved in cell wall biosynthesis